MKILAIDTSNQPLSVASALDRQVLAQVGETNLKSHSIKLLPAIDQVVKTAGWQPQDLDRIVVAQGPGSFTGLRIAVTTAKMLAWTLKKDLVGISGLQVLAQNVSDFPGVIVALMDARNLNVFAGVYQKQSGKLQALVQESHMCLTDLLSNLKTFKQPIMIVGQLTSEMVALINEQLPQAQIKNDGFPQAQSLVDLGLTQSPISDLDNFVPNYLRQTQAELVWRKDHPDLAQHQQNYVQDV